MRPRRHPIATRFALIVSAVLALGGCGDDSDDSEQLPTIEYVVGFNLGQTTEPVGALQFDVRFLGSDGEWAGAAGGVDCRWIVNAALHACNSKTPGRLACAIVDSSGFTGPTELMECSFLSDDDALTAADFDVQVVDASGTDLAPIDADVTITVDPRSGARTTEQSR